MEWKYFWLLALELEWKNDLFSNFGNLNLIYYGYILFTTVLLSKFNCVTWRSLDSCSVSTGLWSQNMSGCSSFLPVALLESCRTAASWMTWDNHGLLSIPAIVEPGCPPRSSQSLHPARPAWGRPDTVVLLLSWQGPAEWRWICCSCLVNYLIITCWTCILTILPTTPTRPQLVDTDLHENY